MGDSVSEIGLGREDLPRSGCSKAAPLAWGQEALTG